MPISRMRFVLDLAVPEHDSDLPVGSSVEAGRAEHHLPRPTALNGGTQPVHDRRVVMGGNPLRTRRASSRFRAAS